MLLVRSEVRRSSKGFGLSLLPWSLAGMVWSINLRIALFSMVCNRLLRATVDPWWIQRLQNLGSHQRCTGWDTSQIFPLFLTGTEPVAWYTKHDQICSVLRQVFWGPMWRFDTKADIDNHNADVQWVSIPWSNRILQLIAHWEDVIVGPRESDLAQSEASWQLHDRSHFSCRRSQSLGRHFQNRIKSHDLRLNVVKVHMWPVLAAMEMRSHKTVAFRCWGGLKTVFDFTTGNVHETYIVYRIP